MIKLAAKQYLKSVGDKYFVPSPDYLEWVNVNCLDIAIKRKPKWIWQDTKYFYDHMNINDLIDSPLSTDMLTYLKKPEPINPKFSWSSKHDINSKIGGKIASLISLDISANDVISVSIDLSGMIKQSIDFHAVLEVLKTKKIDLNNDYIRNISKSKYNSICLVTQYLYLTKETEMKISINWDFSEKSGESFNPKVSINEDEELKFEKSKSIVFDAGTRIAFDFAELNINADGTFELLKRSDQSSRKSMIANLPSISKEVPTYCAHVKTNFDVPDNVKTGDAPMPSKCVLLVDNIDMYHITQYLLNISIDDQTVLKQLYSFMQATQDASTTNLSFFKENPNSNLTKLLKCIGVETDNDFNAIIQCNNLNHDMIERILIKIEAIYQLEMPYLQNFLKIIDERNSELITPLFIYLHNLKNNSTIDVQNRDKLFKDWKYKLLLLSIGVTETNSQVNKYFEPVFILLHGS